MKLTGNTIFITGGGSGIGRGLAEALHRKGNKVIISGRRREALDEVIAANPGMEAVEIDITDRESIDRVAKGVIAAHPTLNVLINNAGIMLSDNVATSLADDIIERQAVTNLMGAIRVSSAFVDHLRTQPSATIVYNSSQTAFIPLAMFAVYSATKAALHSYALSQRFMLKGTSVRVQEIAPPWVGTGLAGEKDDPRAMPLDKFIAGTMEALGTDAEEVLVAEAQPFRDGVGPGEHAFVDQVNTFMMQVVSETS